MTDNHEDDAGHDNRQRPATTTRPGKRSREATWANPTVYKNLSAAMKRQYEELHQDIVVPGKQRQQALAQQSTDSDHPAMPRANVGVNGWTRRGEEFVQRRWHGEKGQWEIKASADKLYGKLFRLCLHLGGCTPWDIVGERTRLQFEPDTGRVNGRPTSRMWSSSLCQYMSVLVTHSAWPARGPLCLANHLAAAIQYAVILRTGDRRPWDPTFGRNPSFQVAMARFSRQSNGSKPVPEVHREARDYLTAETIDLPNLSLSDIFLELETFVATPDVASGEEWHYPVRTADLVILIRALDNTMTRSGLKQVSADVQHETVIACRPLGLQPSGEELERYHGLAITEEFHRQRAREYKNTPETSIKAEETGREVEPVHGKKEESPL